MAGSELGRKPRCSARCLLGIVVPGQAPPLALRRRRALVTRAGLRYRVRPPLGRYPADGVRSPQRPVRPRATHQGKAFPLRATGILTASRRQTWSSLHPERRQAPSFSSKPFEMPEKQSFLRRAGCNLFGSCSSLLAVFTAVDALSWVLPCTFPSAARQTPPNSVLEEDACGVLPSRTRSQACHSLTGYVTLRQVLLL